MNSSYAVHRHARQFALGPAVSGLLGLSSKLDWSDRQLCAHPWLSVERFCSKECDALLIGNILDPEQPKLDNAEVAKELFSQATTFAEFERASSRVGGRWVALVRLGREARLYPDAAGMRSVFFARLQNGAVVAASQPGVLAAMYGLQRDARLDSAFRSPPHFANSWPCDVTPYPGVRQLLPNHYLDLEAGTTHRFWPHSPLDSVSVERAAERIAGQLHGFVAAAVLRGPAALALTAGYDSRTLYAAARELRDQLTIFRVTGQHLPWYDTAIPRRLTRRFGGQLVEIAPQACPEQLRSILRNNVADLWSDPGAYMLYSFAVLNVRYVILGQLAEITRCFYYPDGRHPEPVDAAVLARVAHYGDHPVALAAFSDWLNNAPTRTLGLPILDLFYWEHRAGNWASMMATACDTFIDPVAPYNCRVLLETALGVDVRYRRAPYLLHRLICETATAGTTKVPFNFSWRDAVKERLVELLPWRVRRLLLPRSDSEEARSH